MQSKYEKLRLVLGDQLNSQHTWWDETDDDVLYVMMECLSETNYVRHHLQKVVGFFLAMRHFAEAKRKEGHDVLYLTLDDDRNQQSIVDNLSWIVETYAIQSFEYQLPDEYRLDESLKAFCEKQSIVCQAVGSEHFLSSRDAVEKQFEGKKMYLLETFYRQIRKNYSIMMEADGKTPLTGRWNYDAENRKKMPKNVDIPPPKHFYRNVKEIINLLESKEVETIGKLDGQRFNWPITREESLELLEHFVRFQLHHFGTYQDALTARGYLLFHSKLSFAMNIKMLHPLEVVNRVIQYWEKHQDKVDIAQVEGFVRQIIGWREYMRGIYWAKMPAFAEMNYFEHHAKLPEFFWTGDTKMRCLSHAIGQSLDYAYAHHIQRLMVTGNFALLIGVHPDELDEWYLGIYMDALEWVEITNTRGMSQFADGGIVGTKPYVSSANYIHKMSDYCKDCHFDQKVKYGDKACPFNSLYWDFYDRHAEKLSKNPRIGMMYRTWAKMDGEEKAKILAQAQVYKENADRL